MNDILQFLDGATDNPVVIVFFFVGIVIFLNVVSGVIKCGIRERTRRDIAAYIAEGSMTPEQGERLIAAKSPED